MSGELVIPGLLEGLRGLIVAARQRVATTANQELALLYWRVGQRIQTEALGEARAGYGKEIVATLSPQLGRSHFIAILPLKEPVAREYYAEMCRIEGSNVRTLREKIGNLVGCLADGESIAPATIKDYLTVRTDAVSLGGLFAEVIAVHCKKPESA